MFSIFNKKSKFILPPFEELSTYPDKDKYFYRNVAWYWMDDYQIAVIDPGKPDPVPLELLNQIVFLDSKGNMTVKQYVEYAAIKDKFGLHEELDVAILCLIDMLLMDNLIALSDTPKTVDTRYKKPIDPKKNKLAP
jgi:hypothetical protein